MPEVWLDLINPVDVSTDPAATQGGIVGGAAALRTDDGDASYVEVSNGYDQREVGYGPGGGLGYRDGGFSKTFQVDLEPDGALPDPARILSYDVRWVLTGRMISPGTYGNVDRLLTTGFQPIGSFASTSYVEDYPRGNTNGGPTWEQIQGGGYSHTFRGAARNLLQSPFSYLRITRMRLWVTYTVLAPTQTIAPPLRQYPRSDGLATSSARRMWPPSRSYQRGIRRAGGYL